MITDSWVSISRAYYHWKTFSADYDWYYDRDEVVQILFISREYKDTFLLFCWNGQEFFQFIDDGEQQIFSKKFQESN